MIEAQNKSCNLGYTTASAVFVHLYCINPPPPSSREGGMNWKVKTLKVSAMCLVRLAKISWILKNNGNLFTMFVNQNGSSLYRQDSYDPMHS